MSLKPFQQYYRFTCRVLTELHNSSEFQPDYRTLFQHTEVTHNFKLLICMVKFSPGVMQFCQNFFLNTMWHFYKNIKPQNKGKEISPQSLSNYHKNIKVDILTHFYEKIHNAVNSSLICFWLRNSHSLFWKSIRKRKLAP